MAKLSVDQALLKAKSHAKKGEIAEAQKLYQTVLEAFPKNKRAQQGLAALNTPKQPAATQGPPQETINQLINLYNQGLMSAVVEQAQVLKEQYPEAFIIWNILGAANKGLGRVQAASEAFRKVTELNPTYADGFSNLGTCLQEQGKLDEAIGSYKKALLLKPDYVEAHYNMGIALQDQGKLEEAIEAYSKALSLKPDYAEVYNNMGNVLKEQGKLAEATEAYNKALTLKPGYAEAYTNMGVTLKKQGKLEEAIEAYNKALLLKPDYAEAYTNMGVALQEQGKLEEAIEAYNKTLSLKPNYAEAYYNLGVTVQEQGKLEEAIASYEKALTLKPDYAEAYTNMGVALQEQGKPEDAIEAYNKALTLKPDYVEAHYNMGIALKDQGKLEEAIEAYEKALTLKPHYAEAYTNMGVALQKQGKPEEAIDAYNKALAIKPDNAEAYTNMGVTLQEQGKPEEAIEAYNKALAIKPDNAEVHRYLSSLIKYKPENTQVTLIGEMIQRSDLEDDDRCHLHYAYAKMKEDLGDLDIAFENYVAGGKLRQKILFYDFEQDKLIFNQIKNTAPKLKEFTFNKSIEAATNTPIFILGMPRSGSTLVEQIISSHSKVNGADELPFLSRFGGLLSHGNQIINSENVLQMRNAYLNELDKVSNECPFVTDKMPQNFLHIGLILKALPEAKVIHVKRDPAATCWSNFKHHFSSKGLGYSYNLNHTVSYFKLYQDLMNFWEQQYSDQIYHLDYDKLTLEQEPETRKLIQYMDLDWEDTCLSPQENKRSVRTASQQQVREKVYTGSSQAWRKFEPYLKGTFDELYGE